MHQTLRSVTRDFETFEFNTIISSLMELMNEMVRAKQAGAYGSPAWNEAVELYVKMLAPVAPHITEELWSLLGKPYSIHTQPWPEVDEAAAAVDELTLVVQVNGKVRDRITVPVDISEADARAQGNGQRSGPALVGRARPAPGDLCAGTAGQYRGVRLGVKQWGKKKIC